MFRFQNYTAIILILLLSVPVFAESPLAPVKTDHPRDTMKSFMDAMNDYRKGVETGDPLLKARLDDAVRTLNLAETPAVDRSSTGERAAVFLKEVIDRIIIINYEYIPDNSGEEPVQRWRLKDTEIVIAQVQEGKRAGEFLFTPDTVNRASEFYSKVKHMPYLEGSGQGAMYSRPWLEEHMPEWAQQEFLIMLWWQWLLLCTGIVLGLMLRVVVRYVLMSILKITSKTEGTWDDEIIEALKGPAGLILASGVWYLTVTLMSVEGITHSILAGAVKIILSLSLIWLVYRLTDVLSSYLQKAAEKSESTLDDQLVPLLTRSLKIFVVIFGALVAIQNLGVNVMSVLAGLGIGGLAFALAAKDAVANFFGSLMILFDRPFQVGEWIVVGDKEGTVEEIGFRSTRIRTFYNSVVSIPNSELMNAKIDNMGRREYRRLLAKLGVTYDTSPEKIEAFLEGIKNIIKANPYSNKQNYHVVFNEYGADGLIIMVYMFFKVPDWSNELVERQNILLSILRLAKELGIEFAFPTRTLHIETFPEKKQWRESDPGQPDQLKQIAAGFQEGGANSKPGGVGIYTPHFKE